MFDSHTLLLLSFRAEEVNMVKTTGIATSLTSDLVMRFGDQNDGVIGIPLVTSDGRVIETSYFFGRKHTKNIIVISSQAGCPMRCVFCELGGDRFERNLTPEEMKGQVSFVLQEAKQCGFDVSSIPHKLTIANSGEPLFNALLVDGLKRIGGIPKTIKVSTVFPDAANGWKNFERLAEFSASLRDQTIQIQISLISTSEEQRRQMSGSNVAGFQKIRSAAELWRSKNPNGRKVNLSLILTSDMSYEVKTMVSLFPPDLFRFRFREYVPTQHGQKGQLHPVTKDTLAEIMKTFADAGYETGDWASPTPTERKFGLAANVIRQRYFDMTKR